MQRHKIKHKIVWILKLLWTVTSSYWNLWDGSCHRSLYIVAIPCVFHCKLFLGHYKLICIKKEMANTEVEDADIEKSCWDFCHVLSRYVRKTSKVDIKFNMKLEAFSLEILFHLSQDKFLNFHLSSSTVCACKQIRVKCSWQWIDVLELLSVLQDGNTGLCVYVCR